MCFSLLPWFIMAVLSSMVCISVSLSFFHSLSHDSFCFSSSADLRVFSDFDFRLQVCNTAICLSYSRVITLVTRLQNLSALRHHSPVKVY